MICDLRTAPLRAALGAMLRGSAPTPPFPAPAAACGSCYSDLISLPDPPFMNDLLFKRVFTRVKNLLITSVAKSGPLGPDLGRNEVSKKIWSFFWSFHFFWDGVGTFLKM